MDWREAALDTDSFADVGSGGPAAARLRLRPAGGGRNRRLAEHLLAQLHGTGGTVGRLAEAIVHELEETGYLETPLRLIAESMRGHSARRRQALALVQSLDPPGVAARSLEECIALQAKAADRYDPAMARLIANLDLLATRADEGPEAHLRGR